MSPTPPARTPSQQHNVLLTGDVIDGFDTAQVRTWLAKTLHLPPAKAASLLVGSPRCIKQGLDLPTAKRYQQLFQSQGVAVTIESEHSHQAQDTPTPASKANIGVTQVLRTVYFNDERVSPPSVFARIQALFAQSATLMIITSLFTGVCLILTLFVVGRLLRLILVPPESAASALFTLLPMFISGIVLTLLLRSIIGRDEITPKEVLVDSSEQPKLLQLVHEICQQLGCPSPDKIYLNNNIRCCGDYVYQFPRPLDGERVLRIGLPLVTTCNTRQLAALIAHELSMLRTPYTAFVYSSTRALFNRFNDTADNNDSWTAAVDRLEHKARQPLQQVLVRFFHQLLTVSSWVSLPFAKVTNLLHGFSHRLAVLTADHDSVALVGSRDFVATLQRLHITGHALQLAAEKMFGNMGEQRLANDLPALVKHFVQSLPDKTQKTLENEVERGETRNELDYPNDRERIIRAEDLDLAGIDSQEQPASSLFNPLAELCLQSTLYYYHNQGLVVDRSDLVDISELVSLAQRDQLRDELSASYFNQWFKPQYFWQIPAPAKVKSLNLQERRKLLNDTIDNIRHATPDYMQMVASEDRLYQSMVQYAAAAEVRKAGYRFSGIDFNFSNEQVDNFAFHYDRAKKQYQHLKIRFQQLHDLMGTRVFLGITLHPEAAKRQLGINLLQTLATLSNHAHRLDSLRVRAGFLPILSARMQERKEVQLEKKIQRVTRDICEFAKSALVALDKHQCRFHPDYASVGEFVKAHIKQHIIGDNPAPLEVVAYYSEVLYGMGEANRKINNQIAFIGRDAEQVNKIKHVKLTRGNTH